MEAGGKALKEYWTELTNKFHFIKRSVWKFWLNQNDYPKYSILNQIPNQKFHFKSKHAHEELKIFSR